MGDNKVKSYVKIVSVWIGLLIWSTAETCSAVAYYATIERPANASEQIKAANEFSVRPIDFSAINPKDLGYANAEEWIADNKDVPKVFADAFPILLKEASIENKKVTMLKKDEEVSKGIIVEVAVTKIILNWDTWRAQLDEFICKIAFINAASGQKIFSGMVNVNSRSGNPYAQVWGGSFSLRLQAAAYNTAWVLTKIMTQGKVEPADY
jgi:hypothetical protein